MNRPVLWAAVICICGILTGLSDASFYLRITALMSALGIIFIIISTDIVSGARKRYFALIFAVLFAAAFVRAAYISHAYSSEESAEFLSRFEVTSPGGFDYAIYLKAQGIATEAAYEAYWDERSGKSSPDTVPAIVRSYLSSKLDLYMREEDAGIYKAVLLGDRNDLDEDVKDLYQSSGISHLLAVSGLHVGILGMGLYGILTKRLKIGKRSALIIASALLLFYMALCHMSSSVIRASLMLILCFTAMTRARTYDMRTAAALSLIIIALYRPYQPLTSGFELSFAAVFGISAASDELTRGLGKLRQIMAGKRSRYLQKAYRLRAFPSTLIMSLTIQLTMLPILAWHNSCFPLWSVFLNLIVIPLMSIVVYSGLVLLMLAALSDLAGILSLTAPLACIAGSAAYISAAPGHYILRFYSALCSLTSSLPCSLVITGRPSLLQIALYYFILIMLIRLIAHPEKILCLSGRMDAAKLRAVTACAFALLFLNAVLLKFYDTEDFYVIALDAGQGDSFIIKAGELYITVDGGSSSDQNFGERVFEPCLLSRRITDIDLALISHADSDHTSGIVYLLTESDSVHIHTLALPSAGESEAYSSLRALISDDAGIICLEDLSLIAKDRDVSLSCIYAGNAESSDINRQSDVVLLEKKDEFAMLFTGDAEAADEGSIAELYLEARERGLIGPQRLSVLKAGHHGSRTSSSDALLDTLDPEYVLLSYGEGNIYGHPHEETLERLNERGIPAVSTALNGSLMITEKGIKPIR